MKKVNGLIILGVLIIVSCMIYLQQSGISLRIARLIKPTILKEQPLYISTSVVKRLFPDFQKSKIVLIALPSSKKSVLFLKDLRQSYQKLFRKTPQIIESPDALLECQQDCWIPLPPEAGHHLETNEFIINHVQPLQKPYFTLTVFQFSRNETPYESCMNQKRLQFHCLRGISIVQAKRKMKAPDKKYFFIKKAI